MSDEAKTIDESRVVAALIEAQEFLRERGAEQHGYGFFPGGDPRLFHPDDEVCAPEEIEAHRAACEAWERGERPLTDGGCRMLGVHDPDTGSAIICGSSLGVGSFMFRDPEAVRVLGMVDRALAELRVSP